jgi:hypothetical protein
MKNTTKEMVHEALAFGVLWAIWHVGMQRAPPDVTRA